MTFSSRKQRRKSFSLTEQEAKKKQVLIGPFHKKHKWVFFTNEFFPKMVKWLFPENIFRNAFVPLNNQLSLTWISEPNPWPVDKSHRVMPVWYYSKSTFTIFFILTLRSKRVREELEILIALVWKWRDIKCLSIRHLYLLLRPWS